MYKILLWIGIACLGVYAFVQLQATFQQEALEEELYKWPDAYGPAKTTSKPAPARHLKEGDLYGRLEIPRLDLSVMVMEGDADTTLRLGAGHIPDTTIAIAGHRDTFFRPLKDIQLHDTIRLTTPDGATEYRVVSTKIVGPKDTYVLDNKSPDTLQLVTCYPFYYIGPAPKRFIVEATKN
jgi:sortase A